jgi:hypothetical protein
MQEKLINQFSAFLPAFEFRPTLARFIFLLPARIYYHANIQTLMTILGLIHQRYPMIYSSRRIFHVIAHVNDNRIHIYL